MTEPLNTHDDVAALFYLAESLAREIREQIEMMSRASDKVKAFVAVTAARELLFYVAELTEDEPSPEWQWSGIVGSNLLRELDDQPDGGDAFVLEPPPPNETEPPPEETGLLPDSGGWLTLRAMNDDGWDAALTLPLPPGPGFDLLEVAQDQVMQYLEYVTFDFAHGGDADGLCGDGDGLRREIDRASARLLELGLTFETWRKFSGRPRPPGV